MCGIFAYIGKELPNLSGFLLDGISNLEYRGYDSSGIAVVTQDGHKIFKEVGEVKNLKKVLDKVRIAGSAGIGHTRWATHGKVAVRNAHPHSDCTGSILIVHNRIIENFVQLKKDLLDRGHRFLSETDSEVFAHLVEENLKDAKNFSEAVRISFK